MRVLTKNNFAIYIYDDDHPPPHCHLIFKGGEELVITLPLLEEMYGRPIIKRIKIYLLDHLDELTEVWDSKHPERN